MMKDIARLRELLQNKRILYIATKNADYIRISQEINWIKEWGKSVTIISFQDKGYLKRIVKVFSKIATMSMKDYDIVFVGFMAQMVFLAFPWKFRKATVVTDFFISIYDTLVFDRKKFKEGSLASKLCKWIDKYTIANSNYLIADTKTHGKYFSEEFDADDNNIFVCYLDADRNIYYPRKTEKPKMYKGKYVVLYFGSILPVQGVEIVMEAIYLLEKEKNIHFIVIGPIEKKITKAKTKNVTYIDWLPQEKLAEYISFSDLCLAGHFSDSVNKAQRTIPGKAYIYQAMEKKMILGDSLANRELFSMDDKRIGFVPMGSGNMLAKRILQLYLEERENV